MRPTFGDSYVPIPEAGCWLWTEKLSNKGYAAFGKGFGHRASWEIHRGKIPKGTWVLHRCDVRSCVNPAHLFLGTADDNSKDMVAKGRHVVSGPAKANKVKAACVHGHEFNAENTYSYKGMRFCRPCSTQRMRKFRAKRA